MKLKSSSINRGIFVWNRYKLREEFIDLRFNFHRFQFRFFFFWIVRFLRSIQSFSASKFVKAFVNTFHYAILLLHLLFPSSIMQFFVRVIDVLFLLFFFFEMKHMRIRKRKRIALAEYQNQSNHALRLVIVSEKQIAIRNP